MSSDFLNFGAAAMNIAGTAAIVHETTKMLRCQTCGMKHNSRVSLTRHQKTHYRKEEREEPHRTGHTSKGSDWDFDFRI